MKKIIFLLISFSFIGIAQTEIHGDLESYIANYLNIIPKTSSFNDYQEPLDAALIRWTNIIQNMILGDFAAANSEAFNVDHQVINYIDTTGEADKEFYILVKTSSGVNHWGIFIFNPFAIRKNLVIQAPHPLYDTNTGKESVLIFLRSGARVLFISGTHRCNSSVATTCSGTTTACSSSSQSYRISDQAHAVKCTFQKTTEVLLQQIDSLVVLQPHGFAKQTGDPDLIMSNGTQLTPTGEDYLLKLKQNLLELDNSLTFKVAHVDLSWTRLIATTNTQGRLINGSNNPCNLNPPSTSGRFLHVEQSYSKLRDSRNNWIKFADAVTATFPENPMVGVRDDLKLNYDFYLEQNYPNPFNPVTTINYYLKEKSFVSLKVFDILGRNIAVLVSQFQSEGKYSYEFDGHEISSGIYFALLQVEGKFFLRKMILAK